MPLPKAPKILADRLKSASVTKKKSKSVKKTTKTGVKTKTTVRATRTKASTKKARTKSSDSETIP